MPKPKPSESRDDYMQRCMSDAGMIERHPDEGNRYNACLAVYETEKAGDTNMNKLYSIYQVTKSEKGKDEYEAVASAFTLDRDGEMIDPKGWKLDNYRKNPVILLGHNYHTLPVGRALWVKADDSGLKIKFKLATTDTGKEIQKLIDENILSTLSVGFIPKTWIEPNEEGKSKGVRRIYTECELLEVSLVSVPANPDATIVRMVKSGEIKSQEIIDEVLKHVEVEKIEEPVEDKTIEEEVVEKAGRSISKKTRALVADCISKMMESIAVLNSLIAEPEDEDEDEEDKPKAAEEAVETKEVKEEVIDLDAIFGKSESKDFSKDDIKSITNELKESMNLIEARKKGKAFVD